MWKKVLLLFCALVMALFLFVVPWQYELGIEHNLIHLDSGPVTKEIPTAGLGGPSLFYVGVNKHNTNQILAQGADLYLSLDKGNNWRKLASHFERVLWLGPHLVAEADDKLFLSKDLGESWLPLKLPSTIDNNSKPPSSLGLHTLANHDPILVARSYHREPEEEPEEGTWRDMELTYQNDQVNFVEHAVNTNEWVQYDNHGSKLKFAHGTVDAYLYATEQEEWAATEGGLFFREIDKTQWREVSANWQATSETDIIQSANSEKLLALDRIGRLYLSKDRAITWTKLLNNVTAASFLPDDSVLAAHQDLSAKLITGDATTEITPSRQEMRKAHEAMDLMVSAKNTPFKFLEAHLVGGTHRHIWMALGGPTYFENLPYQNSQYDLIKYSVPGEISPTQLFLYVYQRQDRTWHIEPIDNLRDLEIPSVNPCQFNIRDNNLFLNDSFLASRGVDLAITLRNNRSYAIFDYGAVTYGALNDCHPKGLKTRVPTMIHPTAIFKNGHMLEIIEIKPATATVKITTLDTNTPIPTHKRIIYFLWYQFGGLILIAVLAIPMLHAQVRAWRKGKINLASQPD